MTASGFRDDYDRKAHDILCIVRFGGVGGSIRTAEMHKVGDILRGGPFRPQASIPVPVLPSIPPTVTQPKVQPTCALPSIPALPSLPRIG